ncbi:MAG: hypothetical protein ACPG7F_02910 [Aggregatilineales bacterium]
MTAYLGWLIEEKILYQISTGNFTDIEYRTITTISDGLIKATSHNSSVHMIVDVAKLTGTPPLAALNISFDIRPGSWIFFTHMENPIFKMVAGIGMQVIKLPMKIAEDHVVAFQSLQRVDASLSTYDIPLLEDIQWLVCVQNDEVISIDTLPEHI